MDSLLVLRKYSVIASVHCLRCEMCQVCYLFIYLFEEEKENLISEM